MSREDNRHHQAELEILRRLEARTIETMHFSPKEIAVLLIATVLAFGGLFADDARIVFPSLIISWLAFMYLCGTHQGPLRWRVSAGVVITATYFFMVLHVYNRGLERQQEDVKAKLTAQAFMPTSRNVLRTGITVNNWGGTDIKDHTIGCYLRRVVYSPYGGITNGEMRTTLPGKSTLQAFGDGETSYCIAGIQTFPPDSHPTCADITVNVYYTLTTQPEVKNKKSFRFVADGEDFTYHQQNLDYSGDYCPELRMPPQPPFP